MRRLLDNAELNLFVLTVPPIRNLMLSPPVLVGAALPQNFERIQLGSIWRLLPYRQRSEYLRLELSHVTRGGQVIPDLG